jgi:hypothetical protein
MHGQVCLCTKLLVRGAFARWECKEITTWAGVLLDIGLTNEHLQYTGVAPSLTPTNRAQRLVSATSMH